MDPDINDELAIGSIDLNADSQTPCKSPFLYYRLFSSGNPISEFYCKLCDNSLGLTPPDKCDRCRISVEGIGRSERKVVGFTRLADGIVMGEYLFTTIALVPVGLQMES